MLPSEYQPFVLSREKQQLKDRFQAIGFVLSLRPFSHVGEELYFFARRPTDEDPKQTYTVNLHRGNVRRNGDVAVLTLSEAEQRYGSGERLSVSSPCESVPAQPPLPPPAESQPVPPLGGLTPSHSPEDQPHTPPPQERTVAPPPAKAETVQQQTETAPIEAEKPAASVRRERPAAVAESGKATPAASPVKPTKKKQTALF